MVSSIVNGDLRKRNSVESVFITNPASGLWTVEVFGDEIVQDERASTSTCCISWDATDRAAKAQYGQRQAKMAPVTRPKVMPSMMDATMVRLYAPNQRAFGMKENE
jgi:hypothetical protein